MVHFTFYAGRAYTYLQGGEKNPIGEAVQEGYRQEALDPSRSSYSYEDLPSDKLGAQFAVEFFNPSSERTLSQQIVDFLNGLGATDPQKAPNYQKMPQKDTGQPPSRKNKTTKPVYVEDNP